MGIILVVIHFEDDKHILSAMLEDETKWELS